MKPFRALILLLSFLTGAIQPVVPLLEYHLFKESIIEMLCENRTVPGSDCDGVCYLTKQIQESEENQAGHHTPNSGYYPGFVIYGQPVLLNRYPDQKIVYLCVRDSRLEMILSVLTPPPKIS